MATDIEDADTGILKAVLGLGCVAFIVIGIVAGIIVTLLKVWGWWR